MKERLSAQCWPVGDFIREEMKARGWTTQQVLDMMPDAPKKLAFQLILMKPVEGLILGKVLAKELGRIFQTSKEYWLNLDNLYWEWQKTK